MLISIKLHLAKTAPRTVHQAGVTELGLCVKSPPVKTGKDGR
jgi:hypothetical protein